MIRTARSSTGVARLKTWCRTSYRCAYRQVRLLWVGLNCWSDFLALTKSIAYTTYQRCGAHGRSALYLALSVFAYACCALARKVASLHVPEVTAAAHEYTWSACAG